MAIPVRPLSRRIDPLSGSMPEGELRSGPDSADHHLKAVVIIRGLLKEGSLYPLIARNRDA